MSEQQTPAHWFAKMAEKVAANPSLVDSIKAKFQFNLDGEGGGVWTADLTEAPGKVFEGASENPGCTIVVSAKDFSDMMAKLVTPMNLYMSQKLKVVGNLGLALKLQDLIK